MNKIVKSVLIVLLIVRLDPQHGLPYSVGEISGSDRFLYYILDLAVEPHLLCHSSPPVKEIDLLPQKPGRLR